MNKAIKVTLLTLGGLVLSLAICLFIFIKLMDPNDYKKNISTFIAESTGYEIEFHGPVSLTIFPHIALELNDVSLKNPTPFPDGHALSIKQVTLGLNLQKLLKKQILVTHLSISGGTMHAIRNNEGHWNLMTAQHITKNTPDESALPKTINNPTPLSSPDTPSQHQPAKNNNLDIDIHQLTLKEFDIILEDQQTHQTRTLNDIRFNAPNIHLNLPVGNQPNPLMEILKSLTVQADLAIHTIQSGNLILRDLFFACRAEHGKITFSPMSYTILNGKGNGRLYLDVNHAPIMQLQQNIVAAKAEAAQGDFPLASGDIGISINLTARSQDLSTLTHHLNGDVNINVDNGKLNHLNLLYELTKLEEILTYHQSKTHRPPNNVTLFRHFENKYHFEDSVSEHSTLKLLANHFNVGGSGKIWLIKEDKLNPQLDYNLSIFPDPEKFPKVFAILEKDDIKSATGGGLPLELIGSMSHPKYTIDPHMLKKILIGKTANAILNLLPDGTRDKLNDKLLNKLKRYNAKMNQ